MLGVLELVADVLQRLRMLSGLEQDRRDPPHLREALIAGQDLAAGVDDQDPVGRGFQGRLEERDVAIQLRLGLMAIADVVDDGIEKHSPVHLHRTRLDLHLADITRREPVLELEPGLHAAGGPGQGVRYVRRRQGVDVGDLAGGEVLPRVPVETAGGGVGVDDAPGGGIDQELDGPIPLEDLAIEVVARSRAFRWHQLPTAHSRHAADLHLVRQVYDKSSPLPAGPRSVCRRPRRVSGRPGREVASGANPRH